MTKRRVKKLCGLYLLLLAVLAACDWNLGGGKGEPAPVPQTKVLEIRMTPDTVAVNDTLLIECIIEDSLDSRFKFQWELKQDRLHPVDGKTDGKKIKWVAKDLNFQDETLRISRTVIIDNGSVDSVKVRENFPIIIKNR